MKNSVLIFLLSLSYQFIAQTKPDRCDVVLCGKKEGFIEKEKFLSNPKLRFYNKYCESKILGYEFTSAYKGKVISIKSKSDTLSNNVINFINNFNSTNTVIFNVNCIDVNNNEYVSTIIIKIIVPENYFD